MAYSAWSSLRGQLGPEPNIQCHTWIEQQSNLQEVNGYTSDLEGVAYRGLLAVPNRTATS